MPAQFTQRALESLQALLHQTPDRQPGHLIRMVTDIHGGFHLTMSERRPSDHVISCGDEEILVIEARASNHVSEHHPGGKAAPSEHHHGTGSPPH